MTAFHSDIRIAGNAELIVTETIEVQVAGKQIPGGILRDLPGEYRDRHGNRVKVPLVVEKVLRNRAAEPYVLERLSNGMRLRTGDAARKLPPGKHVYELTYRTAGQIRFFNDRDELYWILNGETNPFGLERLTAEITFEKPVPAAELKVEAHTGSQGSDYNAFVRPGSVALRATRALEPREGMSLVVAFPKGVVSPPTPPERARSYLAVNRGAGVGAGIYALMLVLLAACHGRHPPSSSRAWAAVGAGIGLTGLAAMMALDAEREAVLAVGLVMLATIAAFLFAQRAMRR